MHRPNEEDRREELTGRDRPRRDGCCPGPLRVETPHRTKRELDPNVDHGEDDENPEDEDEEDDFGGMLGAGAGSATKERNVRRKINIEFIEDKSRRHITFSKRKAGIMKKVRVCQRCVPAWAGSDEMRPVIFRDRRFWRHLSQG